MIFLRDFDKNNEKLENFAKGVACAVVPMHAPPLGKSKPPSIQQIHYTVFKPKRI